MYQIEKNIPIPPKRGNHRRHYFPFAEMQVGDSFQFSLHDYNIVGVSANVYGSKHKVGFLVRTLDTHGRIWRVK